MSVIFRDRLYRFESGVFSVAGEPVSPDELPEPVRRSLDREYLRAALGPMDPALFAE